MSGLHVVEVGLSWPPDTFLRHKLAGLAERGVRVTVIASPHSSTTPALPGVEVIPMCDWSLAFHRIVLGAARECLRLGRRRRRLLRRAFATAAPLRPRIRRPHWLWLFAQVAELRPDVVHFEWESAALRYMPLADLWGCPVVMSCHGGLDLYSHSPTHGHAVRGVAGAFDRAAAVHCVSNAVLAEGIRHGLPAERARVIRTGVDLERFRPRAGVDRNGE